MIQLTLVTLDGDVSETISVQSETTTLSELLESAVALLSLPSSSTSSFVLIKDGRPLQDASTVPSMTLQTAGIQDGDLIVVAPLKRTNTVPPTAASTAARSSSVSSSSQQQRQQLSLDFSNLLQQSQPQTTAANTGGLDFSQLLNASANASTPNTSSSAAAASSANTNTNQKRPVHPPIVYYAGMNLQEAQQYNPHPEAFIRVLLDHEHLRKELNYYSPKLAQQLFGNNNIEAALDRETQIQRATEIWRNEMIKGGIESALRATQQFHQEKSMKERLEHNPNDAEAQAYFRKRENQTRILEQYRTVHEEYPESFSNIVMLYVEAKINGHTVQAFCDSGAQSTIMSHKLARSVGLADLIDDRFHGTAVGVGSSKILGKIWIVQLQLGNYFFPCSVTVLEDPPEGSNAKEMVSTCNCMSVQRVLCSRENRNSSMYRCVDLFSSFRLL
jgi:hypothetical protein